MKIYLDRLVEVEWERERDDREELEDDADEEE